jgi:1-acyl-sn-glycerol-3-phosphate acyltransferase
VTVGVDIQQPAQPRQLARPAVVSAPLPVRIARVSVTAVFFVAFWAGSTLLSWVVLPLVRFRMRRAEEVARIRRCQEIVSRGFLLFIDAMRWVRLHDLDLRTVPVPTRGTTSMIVANHPTLVDVTAVLVLYPHTCCVAKSVLFRNPMVGRLLRYCGHIEGGEDVSGMAGAAVLQQALDRLAMGLSVLIFPEGTRSPVRELGRFKRGAFEIAIRAGVPILPIFISCDPPSLMKGVAWYALPKATAEFRVGPLEPVPSDRWAGDSRAAASHFESMFRAKVNAYYYVQSGVTR